MSSLSVFALLHVQPYNPRLLAFDYRGQQLPIITAYFDLWW